MLENCFWGFIWKDDVAARTESPGHEVALSRLTSKLDSASTMHMIKPISARYTGLINTNLLSVLLTC